MTRTRMVAPPSLPVGAYVAPVAPAIATVPETLGAAVLIGGLALTAAVGEQAPRELALRAERRDERTFRDRRRGARTRTA